jgi:hypothetical protein
MQMAQRHRPKNAHRKFRMDTTGGRPPVPKEDTAFFAASPRVFFLCHLHEGEGFIAFLKSAQKREFLDLRRCRPLNRRHFSASVGA